MDEKHLTEAISRAAQKAIFAKGGQQGAPRGPTPGAVRQTLGQRQKTREQNAAGRQRAPLGKVVQKSQSVPGQPQVKIGGLNNQAGKLKAAGGVKNPALDHHDVRLKAMRKAAVMVRSSRDVKDVKASEMKGPALVALADHVAAGNPKAKALMQRTAAGRDLHSATDKAMKSHAEAIAHQTGASKKAATEAIKAHMKANASTNILQGVREKLAGTLDRAKERIAGEASAAKAAAEGGYNAGHNAVEHGVTVKVLSHAQPEGGRHGR